MHRRYARRHGRFPQPDPYDGSYDLADPQSFNRYSYVQNDPVNFVDPSGLDPVILIDEVDPLGVGGFRYGRDGVYGGYLGGPGFITSKVDQDVVGGAERVGFPLDTWLSSIPRPTIGYGPQLLGPQPQNVREAFNAAFAEAQRLLYNNKCAALFGVKDGFGNKSREEVLATLRNTEYRYIPFGPARGPRIDPETGRAVVTGAQTNSATSVFINSQGPFVNQNLTVPGHGTYTFDFGTGLRGASFGALILLHELGHQRNLFGPDANNSGLNRSHTQRVLDACFS